MENINALYFLFGVCVIILLHLLYVNLKKWVINKKIDRDRVPLISKLQSYRGYSISILVFEDVKSNKYEAPSFRVEYLINGEVGSYTTANAESLESSVAIMLRWAKEKVDKVVEAPAIIEKVKNLKLD